MKSFVSFLVVLLFGVPVANTRDRGIERLNPTPRNAFAAPETPVAPEEASPISAYAKTWHWSREAWWLEPRNVEQSKETIDLVARKTDEVNDLIQHYRSASFLSEEIAMTFPKLVGSWLFSPHGIVGAQPTSKKEFLIVWVPGHLTHQQPATVYFNREYNAVFVGALDWPPAVLAGIIFHELGHAMRYRQGALTATAAPGTFLYALEEIETHMVQSAVFNSATAGIGNRGYRGVLNGILSRKKVATPIETLDLITKQDLVDLNRIIGCGYCDGAIASVTTSHHILALGLEWIDRQNLRSKEHRTAVTDWYNLMTSRAMQHN